MESVKLDMYSRCSIRIMWNTCRLYITQCVKKITWNNEIIKDESAVNKIIYNIIIIYNI